MSVSKQFVLPPDFPGQYHQNVINIEQMLTFRQWVISSITIISIALALLASLTAYSVVQDQLFYQDLQELQADGVIQAIEELTQKIENIKIDFPDNTKVINSLARDISAIRKVQASNRYLQGEISANLAALEATSLLIWKQNSNLLAKLTEQFTKVNSHNAEVKTQLAAIETVLNTIEATQVGGEEVSVAMAADLALLTTTTVTMAGEVAGGVAALALLNELTADSLVELGSITVSTTATAASVALLTTLSETTGLKVRGDVSIEGTASVKVTNKVDTKPDVEFPEQIGINNFPLSYAINNWPSSYLVENVPDTELSIQGQVVISLDPDSEGTVPVTIVQEQPLVTQPELPTTVAVQVAGNVYTVPDIQQPLEVEIANAVKTIPQLPQTITTEPVGPVDVNLVESIVLQTTPKLEETVVVQVAGNVYTDPKLPEVIQVLVSNIEPVPTTVIGVVSTEPDVDQTVLVQVAGQVHTVPEMPEVVQVEVLNIEPIPTTIIGSVKTEPDLMTDDPVPVTVQSVEQTLLTQVVNDVHTIPEMPEITTVLVGNIEPIPTVVEGVVKTESTIQGAVTTKPDFTDSGRVPVAIKESLALPTLPEFYVDNPIPVVILNEVQTNPILPDAINVTVPVHHPIPVTVPQTSPLAVDFSPSIAVMRELSQDNLDTIAFWVQTNIDRMQLFQTYITEEIEPWVKGSSDTLDVIKATLNSNSEYPASIDNNIDVIRQWTWDIYSVLVDNTYGDAFRVRNVG